MNWKRVRQIASWEYLQKVRTKSFVVGLLLTPLMVSLSLILPTQLAEEEPETAAMVGLVDTSGRYYRQLKSFLDRHERLGNGQPAFVIANYTAGGASREQALRRVDSIMLEGTIEGAVVIDDSVGHVVASYRSENPGNFRIAGIFENAIEQIVRAERLAEARIDTALFARVAPDISLKTVKVSEEGEVGSSGFEETFLTAYILNFLLMFLVMITGGTLVRSLIEEKSNRIIEILVASATPHELMWGKFIGLSGLGITQIVAWMVLAAIATMAIAPTALVGIDAVWGVLPLLLIYLILGYLFYCTIFVGLGSLVTTEQEAQVLTTILVFALMTPTILAIGVISNPDAPWLSALSFVPLLTPSLMMVRAVTKMPPTGEIVGTIALMIVSIVVFTWMCSKIFRTAILLYGKRPSMREVLRWLKEA